MLKQRLLTALILIPLFLLLLFKATMPVFCLVTGLIMIWGSWEWSFLMGVSRFPHCLFYPLVIVVLMLGALALPIIPVLYIAAGFWCVAALLVLSFPASSGFWGTGYIIRALMGIMVLIPCWLAVNFIRDSHQGSFMLLFLFLLIWGADSGAYFIGKLWGKNKLIPAVSPGKTWQGFFGAIGLTLLLVLAGLVYLQLPYARWLSAIVLCMITVLFSMVGDLFESMLKRQQGLKDSGHLLPGHGGILDRIDSVTAAAPIFALGAVLVGKF